MWHATIKYSIWMGIENYKNNNYTVSKKYLEYVVKYYPKKLSKFHVILGKISLLENDKGKALFHAKEAEKINPNYNSVKQLFDLIDQ